MKIIVGLGNPGDKYAKVRHNLGFMLLDEYVKKVDIGHWTLDGKLKAEIIKTREIIFAKPQTFMNNSGLCIAALVKYFKISPEDVVIVHDELDLPLGKIKVRIGGAAAGHHGVESIINALKTDQFIRIRLGIGNLRTLSSERDGQHLKLEKFVLEPFMSVERPKVKHMVKQAVLAVDFILEKGVSQAQNQFN